MDIQSYVDEAMNQCGIEHKTRSIRMNQCQQKN
jgi:hypothetical protein